MRESSVVLGVGDGSVGIKEVVGVLNDIESPSTRRDPLKKERCAEDQEMATLGRKDHYPVEHGLEKRDC